MSSYLTLQLFPISWMVPLNKSSVIIIGDKLNSNRNFDGGERVCLDSEAERSAKLVDREISLWKGCYVQMYFHTNKIHQILQITSTVISYAHRHFHLLYIIFFGTF